MRTPGGYVGLRAEIERLRQDCSEAYQVVGALAALADLFEHPAVEKALDNLNAAVRGVPRPHADLLPFFVSEGETAEVPRLPEANEGG